MRHAPTFAAAVALAITVIACVDRTPTGTAPLGAIPDLAVTPAQQKVTLSYVCGSTFGVDLTPRTEPRILFSHSTPGVAWYPVDSGVSTYVVGGINETTSIASADAGILRVSHGIIATLSNPAMPCGFSMSPPPAGTVELFYVCRQGWGVRNTNPVGYRFKWVAINDGRRYRIDVPAASAAGPAQVFFGTKERKDATIVLRDGLGETVVDSVKPTLTPFSYTCRFNTR